MTLAIAILGFAFWGHTLDGALPGKATSATALQAASSGNSGNPQSQSAGTDSQPSPAPSSSQKPSSVQDHPAAKKPVHRKKAAASDCAGTSDASPPSSHPAPSANDPAAAGSHPAKAPASSAAPKNCPPEKIIVRQGGTTEPSIQLAGGPGGDDASQKRDATNQMLGEAENNLKKTAGQQLSSNQQDSVTQIRQFMAESKSALATGDVESARTLAWKAKLLSEDLVKPGQ
jgi:hypothetical protein